MKHPTKYSTIGTMMILFLLAGCAIAQPTVTSSTPVLSTAASASLAPAATDQPAPQASSPTEAIGQMPASTSGASDPNGTPASASSGGSQFTIVADKSTVNYRVREQLARLNFPSDAVGKTNAITGSISILPDGMIDSSSSKFVVDVSTLTSDSDMRDNFLRRSTLQSSQFSQVTFVPTQVTGLTTPLPQSGNFSFQLGGDLTVRDVTKPVTWEVTGQIQNGQITAHATTTFAFEDFNLAQPRVPVVLSVEDKITLEADLVLQK